MSRAQAPQPAWFRGWILHISPVDGSPNPHTRPRGDNVNLPAASEHSGVAQSMSVVAPRLSCGSGSPSVSPKCREILVPGCTCVLARTVQTHGMCLGPASGHCGVQPSRGHHELLVDLNLGRKSASEGTPMRLWPNRGPGELMPGLAQHPS